MKHLLTYLVWIDGDTEKARVGVDQLIFVSYNRIPKNTSIIQIRQARHIIAAVKLWWIDLSNLIFLVDFLLKAMTIQSNELPYQTHDFYTNNDGII